jgi:transcriptional regulator with XRE-family HTH domain
MTCRGRPKTCGNRAPTVPTLYLAVVHMDDTELPPEMATPAELLWDLVNPESSNFVISQTELAQKLQLAFQTVWRWAHGRGEGFTPARQRQVCEVLALPPNYFTQHDELVVRERYRQKKFAQFLETDLGHTVTEEEQRLLRAPKFDGKITPTVSMYRAWLLVLRGVLTEEQVERSLEEHRRELELAKAKVEAARAAKRGAKKPRRAKSQH